KKEPAAKDKEKDKPEEKPQPIRIDFDGLAERLGEVPVAPDNYDELRAIDGKLHWLKRASLGMMPPGDAQDDTPVAELQTYEIDKEKVSTITDRVQAFAVSADGKVLVYQTKDGFTRVAAGATEAPKDEAAQEEKVELSGWSISISPRDEWKQMLHEAWRLQRDFFYDPKMHGVDWNGVWAQ